MILLSSSLFRGWICGLPKKHEYQYNDLHKLLVANSDFHRQLYHGCTYDFCWRARQLCRLALVVTMVTQQIDTRESNVRLDHIGHLMTGLQARQGVFVVLPSSVRAKDSLSATTPNFLVHITPS